MLDQVLDRVTVAHGILNRQSRIRCGRPANIPPLKDQRDNEKHKSEMNGQSFRNRKNTQNSSNRWNNHGQNRYSRNFNQRNERHSVSPFNRNSQHSGHNSQFQPRQSSNYQQV